MFGPTHQASSFHRIIFFLSIDLVAVKAGGMRIVQHKTPNTERAALSEPVEVVGLSQNNPLDQAVQNVSSSPKSHNLDNQHASHAYKPPAAVQQKASHHINQPKK